MSKIRHFDREEFLHNSMVIKWEIHRLYQNLNRKTRLMYDGVKFGELCMLYFSRVKGLDIPWPSGERKKATEIDANIVCELCNFSALTSKWSYFSMNERPSVITHLFGSRTSSVRPYDNFIHSPTLFIPGQSFFINNRQSSEKHQFHWEL